MKLLAEIDGKTMEIELRRSGEAVLARVDGREYELEVSEPEPGIYLFKHQAKIFEIFVGRSPTGGATEVKVNGERYDVSIIDPKRLRGSGSDHSQDHGLVEIRSAMPGKVVRLLSSVGENIEKGSGVLVVEAMKMQNELKSPKDGVIKEIRVDEADTVEAGQILAIIE